MKKLLLGLALIALTSVQCVVVYSDDRTADDPATEVTAGELWIPFERGDGLLSANLGAATVITDMVVALNGDIYVCGSRSNGSNAIMMVARFRKGSTGAYAIDTGFGTSGYKMLDIFDSATASVANAMALRTYTSGGSSLEDDHIYLTGQGIDSSSQKIVIVKINKNTGAADTTFNSVGFIGDYAGSGVGHGIVVDGTHIYAVGTDGSDAALMKVKKSDGWLETAFSSDGLTTIDASGSGVDVGYDIVKEGNVLYIAGAASDDMFAAKMNATDGTLYNGMSNSPAFFDSSGIAYTPGDTNADAKALVYDGNHLYLVGHAGSVAGVVKKINKSTGLVVSDFGTSGIYSTSDIDTFEDAKLFNGQLYLIGKNGSVGAIARMNPTGAAPFDTSFDAVGYDVADATNITNGAVALGFLPAAAIPIVCVGTNGINNIELAAYTNNVNILSAEAERLRFSRCLVSGLGLAAMFVPVAMMYADQCR